MQLRSISIIAVLFMSLSLIFTPHPVLATDKEDVRSTAVSFEGKLPGELNAKMLTDHLANGIAVQSDAESIRLHVIAVREGRAFKTHSSETVFLRRRPGRTKIIGAGPLIVIETDVVGAHKSNPEYSFFISSTVAIETPELPTLPYISGRSCGSSPYSVTESKAVDSRAASWPSDR